MKKNKEMGKTGKTPMIYWLFLCICLIPIFAWSFDGLFPLKGVSTLAVIPEEVKAESLITGEYQECIEEYLTENFPGRNILIHIRNQILYSLFRTSPNTRVIMTADGVLYEPNYIKYLLKLYKPIKQNDIDGLIQKLTDLKALANQNGKQMYVLITPSKARYMKIPAFYRMMYEYISWKETDNNHTAFLKAVASSDLDVYDSTVFINQLERDYSGPMFYKSGIHWSRVLGNIVYADFLNWLEEKSGYDFPRFSISWEPVDAPLSPDADLLESLNVFIGDYEQYYKPIVTVKEKGGENKPSVFVRGGSFLGQGFNMLTSNGAFEHFVDFQNNYYFKDNYSHTYTISSRPAYDEIEDFQLMLMDKDIIILEVNESNYSNMSFGLIDYLLEHPDYLRSNIDNIEQD